MALETLLIRALVVAQISDIGVPIGLHADHGGTLIRASVMVSVPAAAFIKDGLRWKDQIKSCPKWMWSTALALGAYALFSLFMQIVLLRRPPLSDGALTLSAFPLGLDAIFACILYSVVRSDYLDRSEVQRRTLWSLFLLAIMIIHFMRLGGTHEQLSGQ
jgi:hypothetical protein